MDLIETAAEMERATRLMASQRLALAMVWEERDALKKALRELRLQVAEFGPGGTHPSPEDLETVVRDVATALVAETSSSAAWPTSRSASGSPGRRVEHEGGRRFSRPAVLDPGGRIRTRCAPGGPAKERRGRCRHRSNANSRRLATTI